MATPGLGTLAFAELHAWFRHTHGCRLACVVQAYSHLRMCVAMARPAQAVALAIFQCGIFVAGLWGVWLRELFTRKSIVLFFIACALLVGGVVIETLANQSESPHVTNSSSNASQLGIP